MNLGHIAMGVSFGNLQLFRYRVHEGYFCSYPLSGLVAVLGSYSLREIVATKQDTPIYFPGGAAGGDVVTGEGGVVGPR
jgi:hypothetical protein